MNRRSFFAGLLGLATIPFVPLPEKPKWNKNFFIGCKEPGRILVNAQIAGSYDVQQLAWELGRHLSVQIKRVNL